CRPHTCVFCDIADITSSCLFCIIIFRTDATPSGIFPLSLHDALPISEFFDDLSRIRSRFLEIELRIDHGSDRSGESQGLVDAVIFVDVGVPRAMIAHPPLSPIAEEPTTVLIVDQ